MTIAKQGLRVSYFRLFDVQAGNSARQVKRVEIPLLQRDYAQGRTTDTVTQIRERFLGVLVDAVAGPSGAGEVRTPVHLDFVYGHIDEAGTLRPLDGQQRLTTLFLLHCYLAWHAGVLDEDEGAGWKRFTYATRPSARRFCEALVDKGKAGSGFPDSGPTAAGLPGEVLSARFEDQPWFQYAWNDDPTVRSMGVMLDAIDREFKSRSDKERRDAWGRLVCKQNPAITFDLWLIDDLDGPKSEALYIRLNARGRPLTAFEAFKAHAEKAIGERDPSRLEEFSRSIDTKWSDLLWDSKQPDALDRRFVCCFRFIVEVCEWTPGSEATPPAEKGMGDWGVGKLEARFEAAVTSKESIDLLFNFFDTWCETGGIAPGAFFEGLFAAQDEPLEAVAPAGRVVLFGETAKTEINLFSKCCEKYGEGSSFELGDTLLLYAVLVARSTSQPTPELPRKLRVLRNLIEASKGNELIRERMPTLLRQVKKFVEDSTSVEDFFAQRDPLGALAETVNKGTGQSLGFNKAQLEHEREKLRFIASFGDAHDRDNVRRDLFRLEDHLILRGALVAFQLVPGELEADVLGRRAKAFLLAFPNDAESPNRSWPDITSGLMATGDFSYRVAGRERLLAGFWWDIWPEEGRNGTSRKGRLRELFLSASRIQPQRERIRFSVLGQLLDEVAHGLKHSSNIRHESACASLEGVTDSFLGSCRREMRLDWRYYFCKYQEMRRSFCGIYFRSDESEMAEDGPPKLGYEFWGLWDASGGSDWRKKVNFDPFLHTVRVRVLSNPKWDLSKSGADSVSRESRLSVPKFGRDSVNFGRMNFVLSEILIWNVSGGFKIQRPNRSDASRTVSFERICQMHDLQPVANDLLLKVPQAEHDGELIDTEDRIELCIKLVESLLDQGF